MSAKESFPEDDRRLLELNCLKGARTVIIIVIIVIIVIVIIIIVIIIMVMGDNGKENGNYYCSGCQNFFTIL